MQRIARLRWWFVGGAIGVLAALWYTPATGWIVRSHVRTALTPFASPWQLQEMGVGAMSPFGSPPRRDDHLVTAARRAAQAQPNDYPVQLASALIDAPDRNAETTPAQSSGMAPDMPPREAALRALEQRIGPSAALCADILRMASAAPVLQGRPESYLISGRKPPEQPSRQRRPSPERTAAFIETARTGERLDPNNAFFPTMLATGLLAQGKDAEAAQAMLRAGGKPHWNDYLMNEAEGRWAVAKLAYGEPGTLGRSAIAASILLPHYASMRETFRVLTYRAIVAEQKGRPDEGRALRLALLRVASTMRVEASSAIGNLVAIACGNIAMERPGGGPPPTPAQYESQAERRDRDRQRVERFAAYLTREGDAGSAKWLRREVRAQEAARDIIQRGIKLGDWMGVLIRTGALALASASQAAAVVWMLLCALAAGGAARLRRIRDGLPMPVSGRWGMPLGIVLSGAAGYAVLTIAGPFAAASLALVVGLPAAAAWLLRRHWTGAPLAGVWAGACIGVLLVLALTALRPWLALAFGLLRVISDVISGDTQSLPLAPLVWGMLPPLAIPLAGLVMVVVSIARRVPVTVGVVRGFARLGIPLACLLVLPYAAIVSVQGRSEAGGIAMVRAQGRHEGRYLASRLGAEWPGKP